MTKQEYEKRYDKISDYIDWYGCSQYRDIAEEYIESLEAELDQLKQDNQALVQQVNALAGKLEKGGD